MVLICLSLVIRLRSEPGKQTKTPSEIPNEISSRRKYLNITKFQGCHGIGMLTANLPKTINNVFTRGIYL